MLVAMTEGEGAAGQGGARGRRRHEGRGIGSPRSEGIGGGGIGIGEEERLAIGWAAARVSLRAASCHSEQKNGRPRFAARKIRWLRSSNRCEAPVGGIIYTPGYQYSYNCSIQWHGSVAKVMVII